MSGGRSAKARLVNKQKPEGFPSEYNKSAQQGLLGVDVLPHQLLPQLGTILLELPNWV